MHDTLKVVQGLAEEYSLREGRDHPFDVLVKSEVEVGYAALWPPVWSTPEGHDFRQNVR